MFSINNYKNFTINLYRPLFVNFTEFAHIINEHKKYNDFKNIDSSFLKETQHIINCGIFLNENVILLKNHNFYKKSYYENLFITSNNILSKSMNIYKSNNNSNYKKSLVNANRVYNMISAVQIRTIINPMDSDIKQKELDNIINDALCNINEQLQVIDIIIGKNN